MLREAVVAAVQDSPGKYLEFLPGVGYAASDAGLARWCHNQSRVGSSGDHLAVRALCDHLGRPVLVWRTGSEKLPEAFLPEAGKDPGSKPLVLTLDERRPGCEHFELPH